MKKKLISILIVIIILLTTNIEIVKALEIYENNLYNIYYNNIKSSSEYKVAKIDGGDRVFYDLDGIIQILQSKGGTNTKVYKLGESLDEQKTKESISKISSELGETIENNDIQTLVDYTGIKEKDNIAIMTKLNTNLIYGITNEIGTNKFIPFAIIKYNIYVEEDSDIDEEQYEEILFSKVDIGSDVESYIEDGKVYYPIRFVSELLGGEINLFKSDETGRDTTGISVGFDIKENFEYEKIFSNEDDEKNNVLSKKQCMSVKVKKEGTEVNGRIYNLDSDTLQLVQNDDLDDFISDEEELKNFKDSVGTISICNSGEEVNINELQYDIFVGAANNDFVPTNLTVKEDEIVIKNTEGITINVFDTDGKQTIKNIVFQKPLEVPLTFDKEFDVNTKEYQTTETLSGGIENVCYKVEFENGETQNNCVYLEPNKEKTPIRINDYTFNILRNIKDFNTKLKSIKYKQTSETEWTDLAVNAEGKYTIENALYSNYELLVETSSTKSTVTSATGEVTEENNSYKIIPKTAIQTFNVVAEDGTVTEYSVNFNYPDTESIELIGIYQGSNTLTPEGPDGTNKYTIKEFDRTQGETVNIKYKVLPSGEEKETGEKKPSDFTGNSIVVYIKNNTYTFEFIEKEGIVVGPLSCAGATVISTGTINGDNVRVRTTPDTSVDTNIIQEFSTGQKLQIIKPEEDPKRNDSWHLAVYDSNGSKCGYVHKQYVGLEGEDKEEETGGSGGGDKESNIESDKLSSCSKNTPLQYLKLSNNTVTLVNINGETLGSVTPKNKLLFVTDTSNSNYYQVIDPNYVGKESPKCGYVKKEPSPGELNYLVKSEFTCPDNFISDSKKYVISKTGVILRSFPIDFWDGVSAIKSQPIGSIINAIPSSTYSDWYIVSNDGKCGYIHKDNIAEYDKTKAFKCDTSNFQSYTTINSNVAIKVENTTLKTLSPNSIIKATQINSKHYVVEVETGLCGFVDYDDVLSNKAIKCDSGGMTHHMIIKNDAAYRSTKQAIDDDSNLVGTGLYNEGDKVSAKKEGDWYKIKQSDGTCLYVDKTVLAPWKQGSSIRIRNICDTDTTFQSYWKNINSTLDNVTKYGFKWNTCDISAANRREMLYKPGTTTWNYEYRKNITLAFVLQWKANAFLHLSIDKCAKVDEDDYDGKVHNEIKKLYNNINSSAEGYKLYDDIKYCVNSLITKTQVGKNRKISSCSMTPMVFNDYFEPFYDNYYSYIKITCK